MEKIAIIGPSGAGKTTLAKELGSRLGLEVYHLDRFFWQPGWTRESSEARINILKGFVQKDYWIIDGTYLNSSELHLQEADTIIFLDISPFVCLLRRIKRHFDCKGHTRRDIPKGSGDKLTFLSMLQILFFPLRGRKKLENKLRKFSEKTIQLKSLKETEKFLVQLEARRDEKFQFSPSNRKKKRLNTVRILATSPRLQELHI